MNNKKEQKKRGPKSRKDEWTTPDALLRIKGWARDGYTTDEIATKCIGIGKTTLYAWMGQNQEIENAIKEGRRPFVEELEDALYKAAIGYTYEETIEEITLNEGSSQQDDKGQQKKHIRRIKKYKPPEPALLIFALKNLKKQKFKDHPIDDTAYDDDPINKLLAALNNEANNGTIKPETT